jgi:hypothetical protein
MGTNATIYGKTEAVSLKMLGVLIPHEPSFNSSVDWY